MTLLITGFEPFGGEQINPSWEAVKLLPDTIGPHRICRLQVPVVFGLAADTVLAEAEKIRPDRILCVGQAGGRPALTPERVALNLRDASLPDISGFQPCDEPIDPAGPPACFATLPVKALTHAIGSAGVPAALSLSAGSFVCNELLYRLLEHYAGSSTQVGFLHVPFLPEQARNGQPSLTLTEIARGVLAAVTCLAEGS